MHQEGLKIVLTLNDINYIIRGAQRSADNNLREFASNLLMRNSIDIADPESTATIPYAAGIYERLGGAIALGQQVSID